MEVTPYVPPVMIRACFLQDDLWTVYAHARHFDLSLEDIVRVSLTPSPIIEIAYNESISVPSKGGLILLISYPHVKDEVAFKGRYDTEQVMWTELATPETHHVVTQYSELDECGKRKRLETDVGQAEDTAKDHRVAMNRITCLSTTKQCNFQPMNEVDIRAEAELCFGQDPIMGTFVTKWFFRIDSRSLRTMLSATTPQS